MHGKACWKTIKLSGGATPRTLGALLNYNQLMGANGITGRGVEGDTLNSQ